MKQLICNIKYLEGDKAAKWPSKSTQQKKKKKFLFLYEQIYEQAIKEIMHMPHMCLCMKKKAVGFFTQSYFFTQDTLSENRRTS